MKQFTTIFLILFVLHSQARNPIERENGVWYPGKSCGLANEIKYLYETSEDTSDIECTFIWSQIWSKQCMKNVTNLETLCLEEKDIKNLTELSERKIV